MNVGEGEQGITFMAEGEGRGNGPGHGIKCIGMGRSGGHVHDDDVGQGITCTVVGQGRE